MTQFQIALYNSREIIRAGDARLHANNLIYQEQAGFVQLFHSQANSCAYCKRPVCKLQKKPAIASLKRKTKHIAYNQAYPRKSEIVTITSRFKAYPGNIKQQKTLMMTRE
jgi:hypothetical protein